MERIERFGDIAPQLSGQLRKGVFTNCFLSQAEYDREIASGLYAHPFDGGLLIFRKRAGYFILNFYLQPNAVPELPSLELPVVSELAWRPKAAAAAAAAARRLQAAGFREQFRRRRYQRPAGPGPDPGEVSFPAPDRADEVLKFLKAHFDRFAGCIPPEGILQEILRNREVVCTEDAGGITGLLHFACGRTSAEIRHLAVRTDCRRQGLAERLLGAYLEAAKQQTSQVWTRQGNVPAEYFYEKHQYRPDGWESVVLLAGGKDNL